MRKCVNWVCMALVEIFRKSVMAVMRQSFFIVASMKQKQFLLWACTWFEYELLSGVLGKLRFWRPKLKLRPMFGHNVGK